MGTSCRLGIGATHAACVVRPTNHVVPASTMVTHHDNPWDGSSARAGPCLRFRVRFAVWLGFWLGFVEPCPQPAGTEPAVRPPKP